MELTDAVVMVTGGASGLGAATARAAARSGARVVVVDLQEDLGRALASEVGGRYVTADVTSGDAVMAAVGEASALGPIRGLVNCAGIGHAARTLDRDNQPHALEHFERVISINLVGTFNCMRIVAAAMASLEPVDVHGGRGAIVNTASVAAFDGQVGQVAYSASKGGIVGLTLPAARDLSTIGVRVNSIAPGIIDTPLLAGLPEAARQSLGQQVLFPKRLGTPEEFAALAMMLLTHDYMNGETVRMDGGIRMAPK